jgi:4-amino-4-deoxy-L-arabinose transferase-like glycosyltransferase
MSNKTTYTLAGCLLIFVFFITVLSTVNDSLTMDELAHLPAGYSYLTQKDMRINPEHPPLIKDLSAVPLLFIKGTEFPEDIKAWKEDVNGQWEFGNYFLFKMGNPAQTMIFWARIPMILMLLVCGLYIFLFAKKLFGNNAAILSLFLFSFSPTFLAHGRLVTTDVGAAAGTIIATYYFYKFLKDSTKRNLIFAGIALGIAELLKFSLILLIPFFGLLAIGWAVLYSKSPKDFIVKLGRYVGYCVLIGLIALAVIWAVYLYHVWNYPIERQTADIKFVLSSFGSRLLVDLDVWMAGVPILRPFSQYLFGLLMVLQRASGGNTGYFMGEISAAGWQFYFPTVYLFKETITFHFFTALAIFAFVLSLYPGFKKYGLKEPVKRLFEWARKNFGGLAAFLFIVIYWMSSLTSNLNIGVRHLMPVFPFTIILASAGVLYLLQKESAKILKYAILVLFLLLNTYSVLAVYPNFITYFNEAVGGPKQGYKYVVDSNLDWGQDLKRLKIWMDKNNVNKVYIDYFGGSDTTYYLKDKFLPWWGSKSPEEMPRGNYLAVSATMLQIGRGKPAIGYNDPTGYYSWLDNYKPVAVIGNSIFVYYIN